MTPSRPPVHWVFPRPHVHEGVPFANAVTGFLVWGEGRTLRVTIGRVDLWDHRGGMPWTAAQNFRAIRAALEARDEPRLKALFATRDGGPGSPKQPFTVPVGTVAFDLGPGRRLDSATLDINNGTAEVRVRESDIPESRKSSRGRFLRILLTFDLARGILCIAWPQGLSPKPTAHPAWEQLADTLAPLSYEPPVRFRGKAASGWAQALPADPAVAAGWRSLDGATLVAAARGADPGAARKALVAAFAGFDAAGGIPAARRAASRWWRRYWADVPEIDIPNATLRQMHDFGMYKFAGLTHPDGFAATLQGPWVEDYQLPPWSNDYHFNINVQMCYWPAFHGNRLGHLTPLFRLIRSWWPRLRENARLFAGVDDGFLLPHAVDDRCTCMGGFWTGAIDHGCTAWVAALMFRYVRYSGDLDFLRSDAFPFMRGAMNVYRAMMEERDGRLSLPVSTSPEYRGATLDAWGRDASFQLAAAHRLAEDLQEAARLLGESPDPMWADVLARLPKATLIPKERTPIIGLWEGTELEDSHRHHSHLASIVPFDTIDLDDPAWRAIVHDSYVNWIYRGPSLWSGWCIAWASMLHTRAGHADAAELWLDILDRLYTNAGHGTRHNVMFPGLSLMGKQAFDGYGDATGEIMQMDAGMAAVAAVQEMLAHERRGIVRLFRGAPERWREVSFRGIRVAGGFLVSGHRTAERGVESVGIESTLGGTLRLESPWGAGVQVACEMDGEKCRRLVPDEKGILALDLPKGSIVRLKRG